MGSEQLRKVCASYLQRKHSKTAFLRDVNSNGYIQFACWSRFLNVLWTPMYWLSIDSTRIKWLLRRRRFLYSCWLLFNLYPLLKCVYFEICSYYMTYNCKIELYGINSSALKHTFHYIVKVVTVFFVPLFLKTIFLGTVPDQICYKVYGYHHLIT